MPRIASRLVRPASLACLALAIWSPPALAAGRQDSPTGQEALKAVRHDWKSGANRTVQARQSSSLPLPANFRRLSAEDRWAFFHARRNLNPSNFDRFHPNLGRLLAVDDRMRAAQSQNCAPMNGLLPDNAHTRYLLFRRSMNPARFDFYHSALGAILVEDQKLKTGQGCVGGILIPPTTPTPTPGTPSPNPSTGGEIIVPRAVPEPGSLALLSLGVVGSLLPVAVRRLRRRGPASE